MFEDHDTAGRSDSEYMEKLLYYLAIKINNVLNPSPTKSQRLGFTLLVFPIDGVKNGENVHDCGNVPLREMLEVCKEVIERCEKATQITH